MNKRIACCILAVLMMASLVACGNSAAPQSSTESTAPTASTADSAPSQEGATRGATGPLAVRYGSAGTGNSDYAEAGTIINHLNSEGILPAGSNVTQEVVLSGLGSAAYVIEGGLADICRSQNALAATRGVEGRAPVTKVRALMAASGTSISIQVISPDFRNKTGYTSVEDVITDEFACTIVTEDVGSTDYTVMLYLFETYGLTFDDFYAWGGKIVFTDNNTASEMIQDGTADIMVTHSTLASSMVTELCMTTDVYLASFSDKVLDYFTQNGFALRTIPAGTFDRFEEDVLSPYVGISFIVSEDMEFDTAYSLTKALVESAAPLQEISTSLRNLTFEHCVNQEITVVPLHEGAVAYYQDIGVLDADGKYIGEGPGIY